MEAESDTVRIIATSDGRIIKALPLVAGGGRENAPPGVAISNAQSVIAIYNHTMILFLTVDGEELWRRRFRDHLCDVLIDDHSPWVALQFRDSRATHGYFEFVSLRDGRSVLRAGESAILGQSEILPIDIAWLVDGNLILWGPLNGNLGVMGISEKDWKRFYRFDAKTLSLTEPASMPGLYRFVGGQQGAMRFVRAKAHDDPAVLSIGLEAAR